MNPTASPSAVADIVRVARNFNARHDITGLLVFDGEHFCQVLEGDRLTVTELVERIRIDPRHVEFQVLNTLEHEGPRRFADWHMAYALDTRALLPELFEQGEAPLLSARLHQRVADNSFDLI